MTAEFEYEGIPKHLGFAAQLLAGGLAGITEHAVMHPLDSIKTRMQLITNQNIYTSIKSSVINISGNEGLKSLWRGVSSAILGAGPAHALYFTTYEQVKKKFNIDPNSHLAIGFAGASATVLSDAFMNPFDGNFIFNLSLVVKQRMQLYGQLYKNGFNCTSQIFKKEGILAFYVSYPTTLMINIPFQSLQFIVYESTCEFLNPKKTYNPLIHIISGGISGAVASAITTPLDVAKTLLQTKGNSLDPKIKKSNGLLDAIKIIYEKQGYKGFWRGIRPRVLTNIPSTALCWTSYEYFKWIFLY